MNSKKEPRKEKLGIFGGTFNPVHKAHIDIADQVLRLYGLDKIFFVPAFVSPHKIDNQNLASPEHRLKMLEMSLKFSHDLYIDDFEIKKGGPSYTIETLKHFRTVSPSLYLIIGIDAFQKISEWHEYSKLFEYTHFIVIPRPDHPMPFLDRVLPKDFFEKYFKTRIPHKEWQHQGGYKIFYSDIKSLPISASQVRENVKQGLNVKNLVPKEVQKYIEKTKLYTT